MIMQYKLVLSDLDGTLLTDEKRLLPSTETTIRKLVKSGALFATASARNKSYSREAILNLSDICCANAYINGALIETPDGSTILDSYIKNEDTAILAEQCHQVNASFCFVTKNQTFVSIRHTESLERIKKAFSSFNGGYSEDPILGGPSQKVYLMMVVGDDLVQIKETAAKMICLQAEIIRSPNSGMETLLISTNIANKETALRAIAGHYQIELEKTLVFGDSPINDTQMIEAAGCGVAMKNAHPVILDRADKITDKNNNEDGVGDYLRLLYGL